MNVKILQLQGSHLSRIEFQARIAPRQAVELLKECQHFLLVMIHGNPGQRSSRSVVCRQQGHWKGDVKLFLAEPYNQAQHLQPFAIIVRTPAVRLKISHTIRVKIKHCKILFSFMLRRQGRNMKTYETRCVSCSEQGPPIPFPPLATAGGTRRKKLAHGVNEVSTR